MVQKNNCNDGDVHLWKPLKPLKKPQNLQNPSKTPKLLKKTQNLQNPPKTSKLYKHRKIIDPDDLGK